MKRVVLNRKNSLFVGNPRGGRTAAILASLTSSCRRHEMDPQLYFMQLLMNLPSWPANDLDACRGKRLGRPPIRTLSANELEKVRRDRAIGKLSLRALARRHGI